jgi:hypothetical protein
MMKDRWCSGEASLALTILREGLDLILLLPGMAEIPIFTTVAVLTEAWTALCLNKDAVIDKALIIKLCSYAKTLHDTVDSVPDVTVLGVSLRDKLHTIADTVYKVIGLDTSAVKECCAKLGG